MNSPGREGRPGHGWRLHHRVASAVGSLPKRALKAGARAVFRCAFQYKPALLNLDSQTRTPRGPAVAGTGLHSRLYLYGLAETRSHSLHCRTLRRNGHVCVPRSAYSPHHAMLAMGCRLSPLGFSRAPPITGEDVRVSSLLPRGAPP